MNIKKKRKEFKILQITKNPFPPEIRVLKEAIAFHDAGYQSAVICPPGEGQANYEVWQGIEIFRPEKLSRVGKVRRILFQMTFRHKIWQDEITKIIGEHAPDVLHVHDIWLFSAVKSGSLGQRLVLDLHENMPGMVEQARKGYRGMQSWFRKFFHSPERIFAYEANCIAHSDLVLTVVQEASERVLREHAQAEQGKVRNVENLESKRFVEAKAHGQPKFNNNVFSILYIGGVTPERGLETVIEAMKILKESGLKACFHIIGADESDYTSKLKEIVAKKDLSKFVNLIDWVPSSEVFANICQADVCCVPHFSNSHTDNTIPHKLYQYMISRRPVLVSSSKPLARTLSQANSGLVFRAGDAKDCSEKIAKLVKEPDTCQELAQNGYDYVTVKGHNWEDESAPVLIEAYDRLLGLC